MASRARVGRTNPDGTVTSIFCGNHNEPGRLGVILREYYTTPRKLNALFSGGDAHTIYSTTGKSKGTLFYERDVDGKPSPALSHSMTDWPKSNQFVEYLFDGAGWLYRMRDSDQWKSCYEIIEGQEK